MKEFTTFIIVVFILIFIALFTMFRDEYGSFSEVSASLEEQVHSLN